MKFQVPQNLDIKDTILFGLGFKQMLYIGGGFGIFITLWLFTGFFVALLLGTPILVLSLLLSFFTFNNQSFVVLFQAMIKFFSNKRIYIWKQDGGDSYKKRGLGTEEKKESLENVTQTKSTREKQIKKLNNDLIFQNPSAEDEIDINI